MMYKPLVLAEREGVRRMMQGQTMGENVWTQKYATQPIEDKGFGVEGLLKPFFARCEAAAGAPLASTPPLLACVPSAGAKVAEKVSLHLVPRKSDLQAEFLGKKLPHP